MFSYITSHVFQLAVDLILFRAQFWISHVAHNFKGIHHHFFVIEGVIRLCICFSKIVSFVVAIPGVVRL